MCEGKAELAGNLLCELDKVMDDLRHGYISKEMAHTRIAIIRKRRLAAQRELHPQMALPVPWQEYFGAA